MGYDATAGQCEEWNSGGTAGHIRTRTSKRCFSNIMSLRLIFERDCYKKESMQKMESEAQPMKLKREGKEMCEREGEGSYTSDDKLNCISHGGSNTVRRISKSSESDHDLMICCLDYRSSHRDCCENEFHLDCRKGKRYGFVE